MTLIALLFQILLLVNCVKMDILLPSQYNTSVTGEKVKTFFLQKLLEKYGKDQILSVEQLELMLKQVRGLGKNMKHSEMTSGREDIEMKNGEAICSSNITCNLTTKCLTASDIFTIHGIPVKDAVSSEELDQISPAILYQAQNSNCKISGEKPQSNRPSPVEVWGYGFLAVTLINLCAVLGLVFLPLMRQKFYKKMLLFMVALAVGTLAGSALLVLIPDALGIPHLLGETYIWKTMVVIGGVYLFFLVERLLHIYSETVKENKGPDTSKPMTRGELETLSDVQGSVNLVTRARHDSFNMTFDVPEQVQHNGHVSTEDATVVHSSNQRKIKPVAWMVIFGDGLHNFIDGLSIGAAFSENILAGLSVSVAVICEELPHELGDFAILLNAGMSMKRALLFNFLSACMCYLGLVFGILVGEMTSGSPYIFALAGGMFLYISLVDMLPEVNHAAEEEGKGSVAKQMKILLLQNVGLICGFGIILILTKFASQIDLTTS